MQPGSGRGPGRSLQMSRGKRDGSWLRCESGREWASEEGPCCACRNETAKRFQVEETVWEHDLGITEWGLKTRHRRSCRLNLRVHKWVKNWKQVFTEHLPCMDSALRPWLYWTWFLPQPCGVALKPAGQKGWRASTILLMNWDLLLRPVISNCLCALVLHGGSLEMLCGPRKEIQAPKSSHFSSLKYNWSALTCFIS